MRGSSPCSGGLWAIFPGVATAWVGKKKADLWLESDISHVRDVE